MSILVTARFVAVVRSSPAPIDKVNFIFRYPIIRSQVLAFNFKRVVHVVDPLGKPEQNQAGIRPDVIAHFQNQLRSFGIGQPPQLCQFCVGRVRVSRRKQLRRVLGYHGCVDRYARILERLDEYGARIVRRLRDAERLHQGKLVGQRRNKIDWNLPGYGRRALGLPTH